jgi:DNA-binding HxlR family transcriptional regulator
MAEANGEGHITERLDRVIHERARLGIMAILVGAGQTEFTALKKMLSLTDGNLSAHLRVLEKNNYIIETKEFVGRRPKTAYRATEPGIQAFRGYMDCLEKFLRIVSQEDMK